MCQAEAGRAPHTGGQKQQTDKARRRLRNGIGTLSAAKYDPFRVDVASSRVGPEKTGLPDALKT